MRQNYFIILLATLLTLFAACDKTELDEPPVIEDPKLFVAGYLPWYGFNNFDFEALKHIDRLYYFSISPDSLGDYRMPEIHQSNIELLNSKIAGTTTELFIAIGGWYESATIFPMAEDPTKRETYVNSIVDFCIENKLAGVDLDWEAYPDNVPTDDYIALVQLLSEKLHNNNLKFTVAVAASHYNISVNFKNLVDQLNIMSYGVLDTDGNQVDMELLKSWLSNYEKVGIPRSKLIVGVPFYGKRPYDASDNSPRALTYSTIAKNISPEYNDNKYGKYAFNGRALMQTKTKFLRENSYYGIMAWELSQDTEYNSKFSLLNSIVTEAK